MELSVIDELLADADGAAFAEAGTLEATPFAEADAEADGDADGDAEAADAEDCAAEIATTSEAKAIIDLNCILLRFFLFLFLYCRYNSESSTVIYTKDIVVCATLTFQYIPKPPPFNHPISSLDDYTYTLSVVNCGKGWLTLSN